MSSFEMGINAPIDFEFFAESIDIDFFLVAMPYTLLDQKSLHSAMKVCIERGVKIVLGAPFASGLLTNPDNPEVCYNYGPVPRKVSARAVEIQKCCKDFRVPLMAAALQFPLFHPAVCFVVTDARTAWQFEENVKDFKFEIPKQLWVEMKRRFLILHDAPV